MRGGKLACSVGVVALITWWAGPARAENARGIPAAPSADVERTAVVGFDAPGQNARLQSNWHPSGEGSGWYTVCIAPCTRRVPHDATFRAAGEGFDPSEPFELPEGTTRVLVTSTLEHRSRAVPALLLAGGLASFFVIGPTLFVVGIASGVSGERDAGALFVSGSALIIGGAIAGTVGAIMLLTQPSRKSSVTLTNRSAALKLPGGFALEPRGLTF